MQRPANCFLLFAQDYRKKIQVENPECSNSEVSSILGKRWENLDVKSKEHYTNKAKELSKIYEREKKYFSPKPQPKEKEFQFSFKISIPKKIVKQDFVRKDIVKQKKKIEKPFADVQPTNILNIEHFRKVYSQYQERNSLCYELNNFEDEFDIEA